MPAATSESPNGLGVSGGFGRRASRVLGNAALYQLVEDMANSLDGLQTQVAEIHTMCTRILAGMTTA